jgi:hypothetical protein
MANSIFARVSAGLAVRDYIYVLLARNWLPALHMVVVVVAPGDMYGPQAYLPLLRRLDLAQPHCC